MNIKYRDNFYSKPEHHFSCLFKVVRALDCDEELSDLSNGVKYGQSTMYNSDQYSQDIIRFRRMAAGDDDSMEYESTASKLVSNDNQTSWKSPERSTGLGNSYGHETGA